MATPFRKASVFAISYSVFVGNADSCFVGMKEKILYENMALAR